MTMTVPALTATARAVQLVAERRPVAEAIGSSLGEHVNDPDRLAGDLVIGLRRLADPEYLLGQRRVAPGIGPLVGVRGPLLAAVGGGFRRATRGVTHASLLLVADRLFREDWLEVRWFAFGLLEATLAHDPERTWQLLRRAAREAGDWITVDSLARPIGRGILAEPYRWAEIEQLVFSPSRWERRLVGSTVATIPFVDRRLGRSPDVAVHGLDLIGMLIGDAEPDVQKALSWAYRSMLIVDRDGTVAALRREADRAAATEDGFRAWVVRDTLSKLDRGTAAQLRQTLTGIRRHAGRSSTSNAGQAAAAFGPIADPRTYPTPPLGIPAGSVPPITPRTTTVSQEHLR